MNLRTKNLTLVVSTLLVSVAALFLVAASITRESYGQLELDSAHRDLQRLENVFLADFGRLFATLEDYAYWDETYDFVRDRNGDYVRSNFSHDTFSDPAIDIVLIVDRQGRRMLSRSFAEPQEMAQPALDYLLATLQTDGDLYEDDPEEYGVVAVGADIFLIAMAPIFRSNGGGVSPGIMLAGRFLNADRLVELREKTQLDVSVRSLADIKHA